MANNNIGWGSIYATSYWGLPTQTGWGDIYYNDANPTPPAPPLNDGLEFVWDTSVNSELTLRIAKWTGSPYNFNVDWGDGTSQTGLTSTTNHTYTSQGVYNVVITGDYPHPLSAGIFMTDSVSEQITELKSWGNNMEYQTAIYSLGDTSITSIDFGNFNWGVDNGSTGGDYGSFRNMFTSTTTLTSVDFRNFSTSNRTSTMDNMFTQMGCTSPITSVEWGNFDFSGFKTGGGMNFFGETCQLMTTAQYNNLLSRLVATAPSNMQKQMYAGLSKYSAGQGKTDRDTLITNGWTIIDGGQA